MSNRKKEQDGQGVAEVVNTIRAHGDPHAQTILTTLLMKLANLETLVGSARSKYDNSARTEVKK